MQVPVYPGRGTWPDWNNPEILQRDRLPARAAFVPFPDQSSCRHALERHRRYLSPWVLSLRGDWDFRYYPSLLQLPENILSFRSGFSRQPVPASAPLDGAVNQPAGLPFPLDPPHVLSDQPVLVYRRTCRLPLLWSSLRKRMVLQGSRAACHVFVNGKCAGYTQGSGMMAEFDVTSLLHDGDNELFVFVYPFSCGSYLEDQPDRPWFGLIREVTLEAVPSLTIHDVHVSTSWQPEEEAWRLDLTVQLVSCRIAVEQPLLHASLRLEDESCYEAGWTVSMKPADPRLFATPVQTTGQLHASMMVRDILPWCDETPLLYDLYISLTDRHGQDLVCVHQPVGFRWLEQKDGQTLINGRPLRLRGVRWSGLNGDDPLDHLPNLIATLRQYRQQQINTIWFCHVPPDPILLDLCDVYGFYVIEDAPLSLQDDDWPRAMRRINVEGPLLWAKDRLLRLIQRDRNHPCLIAWSCALFLETGQSPETAELSDQLSSAARQLDPERLLHGIDLPDLGRQLNDWLNHQAGRLADLNWLRLPEGEEIGWCLLDHDSPPEFSAALGQLLQPIQIQAVNPAAGSFELHNRMTWRDAGLFTIAWDLLRQGRPVLSGELDLLPAEPGQRIPVEIWYGDEAFQDDAEYAVHFTMRYAKETLWAAPGQQAGHKTFLMQQGLGGKSPAAGQGGRLRLEAERHHLIVSGSRFWMVFNRLHASLESWRTGDREMLAARAGQSGKNRFLQIPLPAGLHLTLMRQPEPLDGPDWSRWIEAGYDRLQLSVSSVDEGCDGRTAVIDMVAHMGVAGQKPLFHLVLRYEIASQGNLRLFASLTPMGEALPPPCFGFAFNPARPYHELAWFGSGPERQPARLGLSGAVAHHEAMLTDLAKVHRGPGLFRDVRRLVVRDDSGFGLSFTSDHLFAFDVCPADLFVDETGTNGGRLTVQLLHQASLACRPITEPLKLMIECKPVV